MATRSTATRQNIQIAQGSYTGNGTSQTITLGFMPCFVIVKSASTGRAIWKNMMMPGANSYSLSQNTASDTTQITGFTSTGFTVGSSGATNQNTVVFYYMAFGCYSGQQMLRNITYLGDGTVRSYTEPAIGFTPNLVIVRNDGLNAGYYRCTGITSTSSFPMSAGGLATQRLTGFLTNGFSMGSVGNVNSSGSVYYGTAMRDMPGIMQSGTYTGTGQDGLAITGVGFQPDILWIRGDTAAVATTFKTTSMPAGQAVNLSNQVLTSGQVNSLDSNGFTVGTDSAVNSAGITYYWQAWKAGSFSSPVTRTTATGRSNASGRSVV